MTETELYARHYFNLGLNVTCISNHINEYNFYCRNILKTPNHKWKHFLTERQLINELDSYDWNNATGVGSVTGFQNVRVIDIDGCADYNFLDEVLNILGLPSNYEWVTNSGSKNGFHIFVSSNKFTYLSENQVVTTFPPKENYKHIFEKIEILWNTHVVLPPSIHNSGSSYSFLNCRYPKALPKVVGNENISNIIEKYLEAEKKVIGRGYGEVLFEFIPPNIPSDLDEEDISQLLNKTVVCIIDIETDGLPKKNFNSIDYPNVVQVAWLLMDTEGNIFKKESELINYPNIIYTEAFLINNIDINLVKRIGKKPEEVYRKLVNDIKISNYIVAHNVDFDIPIIRSQLKKYFMQDPFISKMTICTMKETINFCRIPNFDGQYKFPKLTELYKKLFDYEIEQRHNAESDVLLTAKCFKELLQKGIIEL
jgi:DNA polymerase III epsilon subunit-like protein